MRPRNGFPAKGRLEFGAPIDLTSMYSHVHRTLGPDSLFAIKAMGIEATVSSTDLPFHSSNSLTEQTIIHRELLVSRACLPQSINSERRYITLAWPKH